MLRSVALVALAIGPMLCACTGVIGSGDEHLVGDGGASAAGSGGATSGVAAEGPSGPGATVGAGTLIGTGGWTSSTTSTSNGAATSTGAGGSSAQASTAAATTSAGSGATSTSSGASSDPAQMCVDFINMQRASIGLPPFGRWTFAEPCTAGEAQTDANNNTAHSAFPSCGEWAQNECPGWPGPPEAMIDSCLQLMWNEGPGADFRTHGHYINMTSTQYTLVSCAFYVLPNGTVWATQDFQ